MNAVSLIKTQIIPNVCLVLSRNTRDVFELHCDWIVGNIEQLNFSLPLIHWVLCIYHVTLSQVSLLVLTCMSMDHDLICTSRPEALMWSLFRLSYSGMYYL